MALTLYYHPLASFCHKVLIALYENGTEFRRAVVDLQTPASRDEFLEVWPVGKIPVLHDASRGRTVPETSIIVEYLEREYPGRVSLLPSDASAALEARLWDRFFDQYVNTPMAKVVTDRIRPADRGDRWGVDEARSTLRTAYELAERQLRGRTWAIGDDFTLADCAAAPALFYASVVAPFGDGYPSLSAYFERLIGRPSFARVLDEARPFLPMFPYYDAVPRRFLGGDNP